MRRVLLAVVLACACHQQVMACINDSSTQVDEQQFASGYGERAQNQPQAPIGVQINTFHPAALLLIVPSLTLLAVALLWLRQERALAGRPRRAPSARG
jgi:hypothetical protein